MCKGVRVREGVQGGEGVGGLGSGRVCKEGRGGCVRMREWDGM